jgi:hypothetical protein
MQRLVRSMDLPLENVTRQDFYDLLETAKPAAGLVDGETVTVVNEKLFAGFAIPRWLKFKITHEDLTTDDTVHRQELMTIGDYGVVLATFMKPRVAFTTGGSTGINAAIGTNTEDQYYQYPLSLTNHPVTDTARRFNMAVSKEGTGQFIPVPGTIVNAVFTVSEGYASDVTAGEVDVYLLYCEMN